jgi:hypothetical protein
MAGMCGMNKPGLELSQQPVVVKLWRNVSPVEWIISRDGKLSAFQ